MDFAAIVANFYARAGYVHLNNGETGSVTFIGTVSPAGGNLKEPVTENTKKVARCFYALEQERADRKRYPAVNPIDSYSKYLEYPEFQEYIAGHISPTWIDKVNEIKTRMLRGKEISEQINILGDDGVPVEYHVSFLEIGTDRLRDPATGCIRCDRRGNPSCASGVYAEQGCEDLSCRVQVQHFPRSNGIL
mgnify:CR=1 FL=1